MENITLTTPRLTLRFPLPEADAAAVLGAISHRDTLRFLTAAPKDYTLQDAENFIRLLEQTRHSPRELELGAFIRHCGRFVGMFALENIDREAGIAMLGYWLSKPCTGRGLAQEACTALLGCAFGELGLRSVNAYVVPEHQKSIALLVRLGFSRRELLPDYTRNGGKLTDMLRYELEKPAEPCTTWAEAGEAAEENACARFGFGE